MQRKPDPGIALLIYGIIWILLTIGLIILWTTPAKGADEQNYSSLLKAIRMVESDDNPNAIGDNGLALGAYQIHYSYWFDATQYDKSIGGSYNDCTDTNYATKIVLAYWHRYAPDALSNGDDETLARIENGGPKGASKDATLPYWNKVQKAMEN